MHDTLSNGRPFETKKNGSKYEIIFFPIKGQNPNARIFRLPNVTKEDLKKLSNSLK